MAPHVFINFTLTHILLINGFDVRRLGKRLQTTATSENPTSRMARRPRAWKKNITKSIWNVYQAFKAIDIFQRRWLVPVQYTVHKHHHRLIGNSRLRICITSPAHSTKSQTSLDLSIVWFQCKQREIHEHHSKCHQQRYPLTQWGISSGVGPL